MRRVDICSWPATAPGRFAVVLATIALLAACNAPPSPPTPAEPPAQADATAPRQVGGDRDAHGCIASAGYRWCERSARCERPWELAKAAGFENTAEAFERHCRVETAGDQTPAQS